MKDILIAFRYYKKRWGLITLHVLSTAVSIGCLMVTFLSYQSIYNFDHNQPKRDKIYRVNTVTEFQGTEKSNAFAPTPLYGLISENLEPVTRCAKFAFFKSSFRVKNEFFGADLAYADPDFFNMFLFDYVVGSPRSLSDKKKIIINETLALKYFGRVDVIGETLEQVTLTGSIRAFEVAGVYKIQPPNSSFNFEACINYSNLWEEVPEYREGEEWRSQSALFVEVEDNGKVQRTESLISNYTELNNKVRSDFTIKRFELHCFNGMAIRDRSNRIKPIFTQQAPPIGLFIGVLITSLFIFLIVCFNWINATAIDLTQRLKEIGIRKALGSNNFQLIWKIVKEIAILVLFSVLIGFLTAHFFLVPFFNQIGPDAKIEIVFSPTLTIYLFLIFIVTVVFVGSYPFLYLNKFAAINVVLSKPKSSRHLPRILLMVQQTIAMAAVIISITLMQNAKFQQRLDLGFNAHAGIYAWVNNKKEYELYRNALLENKDIASITFSKDHLFISSYKDPIKYQGRETEVKIMDVGDDYLKTVGLTLLEGRDFINDSETDKRESVIISSSVASHLGLQNPVGQEIILLDSVKLNIIGVIKDIYNNGLWKDKEPMMLRYADIGDYPFIIVSTTSNRTAEVNVFMEKKWNELFPSRFYPGRLLNAEIYKAEVVNSNMMKMFLFLGSISILLTVVGLFNLVSRSIEVRMKEIGIRKALGASSKHILWEIARTYVFMFSIAVLIAMVSASYLTEMLMKSLWYFFHPVTLDIILMAAVLLILISALAIAFKINQAIKTNIAEVLRVE